MSGAESYYFLLNGTLVPIQNLNITTFYDVGYSVTHEAVSFTGSPEIAAVEGDSHQSVTLEEFKDNIEVGSANFFGNPFSYNDDILLGTTPGSYSFYSHVRYDGEFDAGAGSPFTGTQLDEAISDRAAITPFAGVTLTFGPGPGPVYGTVPADIVTITPSSLMNGLFSDPNQATDGGHFNASGGYVLTGTASEVTSALDGLVFTPTPHEVAAGQSVTTTFALQYIYLGAEGAKTEIAGVIATASADPALHAIDGPANGYGVLIGTKAADLITAHGTGNVILAPGDSNVIMAGDGGAIVGIAGVNDDILLGGGLNLVHGGNGRETVSGAPGGSSAVFLGNGNDVVQLGGDHDLVALGNGNNNVSLLGGMSFVSTGSGNDVISVAGLGDTVNAGGGNNTIYTESDWYKGGQDTIVLPKASKGFDSVEDFDPTSDKLDLRQALAATNWNGAAATLGSYVQVTPSSTSSVVSISSTANGTAHAIASLGPVFMPIATPLHTAITLSTLVSDHALIT